MKRVGIIVIVVLFFGSFMQAQVHHAPKENDDDSTLVIHKSQTQTVGIDWSDIKPKLVIGGNVGLSFFSNGNINYTLFQISPQIGYKVKEHVIAGAGVQLLSISSGRKSYWEYGPDVFLRAHLLETFFAQAQFEYLNFEDYLLPGKRVWNPAMLFGFGYGTYGYSFGIYTNVIQNRFSDQIYPGNFYVGQRPFFFKGQLLFNLDN